MRTTTGPRARRRPFRKVMGTSLASVLLLGGGAALAEEGTNEDDGDGDDLDGEGVFTAQGTHGELEPCSGAFGEGKVVVVFDDPELGDTGLDEQLEDLFIIGTDGDGTDCEADWFGDIVDYEDYADSQFPFADPSPDFDPTNVPEYDGRYIGLITYTIYEDADPDGYRLEALWHYQGVDPPLHFVEPIDYLPVAAEGTPLGDADSVDNWVESMETPIILSGVEVAVTTAWFDADGDPGDAPDAGWQVTLSIADHVLTLPGDEGESAIAVAGTEYTVAAEAPEGFEVVACDDAVEAVATGTGDFTADADGTHVVCVAEEAAAEPAPEPEPIVDDEEDEDDVIPATGAAPLGLLALSAGLTLVGARLVRRRD